MKDAFIGFALKEPKSWNEKRGLGIKEGGA